MIFEDDDAAIKFFEQKYEEIKSVRRRMNKKRPRKIEDRTQEEMYLDEYYNKIRSEFSGGLYLTE